MSAAPKYIELRRVELFGGGALLPHSGFDGSTSCTALPPLHYEWLLKAALYSPAEALKFWEMWRRECGGGEWTPVRKILPQVYWNLKKILPESDRHRLRKEYLAVWRRQTVFLEEAKRLTEDFTRMGISPVVLKGLSVSLLYYPQFGLRPMWDIDLWISKRDAERAYEYFVGRGWTTTPADTWHSIDLKAKHHDLPGIDLHWHILQHSATEQTDGLLLRDLTTLPAPFTNIRTLRPTEQLFHLLVHGLRTELDQNWIWVSDCIRLIRSDKVDWNLLSQICEKTSLVLPVQQGLRYLEDRMGAKLPPTFVEQLDYLPIPAIEAMAHSVRLRPRIYNSKAGRIAALERILFDYLVWLRENGKKEGLGHFLEYQMFVHKTQTKLGAVVRLFLKSLTWVAKVVLSRFSR